MGLLKKKTTRSTPPAAAVTLIAHGTQLEGSLRVAGTLHVDGEFNGEIHCADSVCVGTRGVFNGAVKARVVLVSGSFEGSIDCQRLDITDTGHVVGQVVCEELVVDGGGRFSGSRRTPEQDTPAAQPEAGYSMVTQLVTPPTRKRPAPLAAKNAQAQGFA